MEKPLASAAAAMLPSNVNGKRGPTCSLSGSSSSEGEGSDHEEIPPSPCSSTSSGPTYVRPPGFKHHGQEIKVSRDRGGDDRDPKPKVNVRIKRKIKRQSMARDVLPVSGSHGHVAHGGHVIPPPSQVGKVNKEEKAISALHPGGMKTKIRKDPIPMRLRALPQSFWQQPNTVNSASPGSMYSVLPPLCKMEQSSSDLADIRPVTPPSDGENPTLLDATEIKKEPVDKLDYALLDKESLKLDLSRVERDLSRDRDSSSSRDNTPRDREITPRNRDIIPPREKDNSPRDMDISPREKDISPRERDFLPLEREKPLQRDRDLTPRDKREPSRDRDSILKEKAEIAREKDGGAREPILRENGTTEHSRESAPRPVAPDARKKLPRPPPRIVRVSQANTELLAKLFEGIEGEGKKKMVRRGRPKREFTSAQLATLAAAAASAANKSSNNNNNNNNTSTSNANSISSTSTATATAATTATTTHNNHQFLIGEDPFMIDSVAEGLLPMLSLETSRQSSGPTSHLSIISIRGDNDRMLSLPSLSVDQNHSAILSELVKAL